MKRELTQQFLLECFNYDPESGVLSWKDVRPEYHFKNSLGSAIWHGKFSGKAAGSICRSGLGNIDYLFINVSHKGVVHRTTAHRIIWCMTHGAYPDMIDHIDGEGLNNTPGNLRECTKIINGQNQSMKKNNTSGVTGVFFHQKTPGSTKNWHAKIHVNGNNVSLGSFYDFDMAAQVRLDAEKKYNFTDRHGKSAVGG